MDPKLFQDLVSAVALAIVGLLAFAFKGLITVGVIFLKSKIGVSNTELLKGFVATTVRFLEQSPAFKDLSSPEKKERAIAEVVAYCQSHGLPIDHDFIDKLIEEAVSLMNENKIDLSTIETVEAK